MVLLCGIKAIIFLLTKTGSVFVPKSVILIAASVRITYCIKRFLYLSCENVRFGSNEPKCKNQRNYILFLIRLSTCTCTHFEYAVVDIGEQLFQTDDFDTDSSEDDAPNIWSSIRRRRMSYVPKVTTEPIQKSKSTFANSCNQSVVKFSNVSEDKDDSCAEFEQEIVLTDSSLRCRRASVAVGEIYRKQRSMLANIGKTISSADLSPRFVIEDTISNTCPNIAVCSKLGNDCVVIGCQAANFCIRIGQFNCFIFINI